MQFSSTILSTLLLCASSTLAAPISMAAPNAAQWTIESLKRTCDDGDKTCVWTFNINTGEEGVSATSVDSYTVNATDSAPASRAIGQAQKFGNFTVTSTWSGQFGEGEGFTTMSVIDYAKGLIVYPAYKDTQLVNGQVVSPDQSYPVQNLPS
ncbi:uncharacterized protein GGS22DRAFT_145568 [Annulohypoxylon maeteangense]|uniref:uncharacterized protein n=1 Tax=Annulohypoxylon maeteangense TaxID=1927788 RepID=UPI002008B6B1|nr:uncharacterized protein GGS22DRAFT_145568 [Annulohypoxylon maeteangense]KAI0884671.1 hypothetical protein GGS22DRAFT_145568 [Annulohypoxylon maeteangense]